MRSIQSILGQQQRHNQANGLPCGEHVYTNKCADQEAYRALEAMIPRAEYEAIKEERRKKAHDKRRPILMEAGIDIGEYKPYYKKG